MILWEGTIQARVRRFDPETNEMKDYWFDTLEKGVSMQVYNSFMTDKTSLLDFYSSSSPCRIYYIDHKELIKLS